MTVKNMHTIILADDHPLLRKGLKDIIETDEHFRVIGESGNGEEALRLITQLRPDIAVLDIDMPGMNGLEIAAQLERLGASTRIIILTMHEKENMLHRALDVGVMGYLLKDSVITEIRQALSVVSAGNHFVTPSLSRFLVRRSMGAADDPRIGLSQLTPTERRVLRLIADSRTTKEIAEELVISNRTVDSHRANICTKLDLHGPGSLLRFALEHKELL